MTLTARSFNRVIIGCVAAGFLAVGLAGAAAVQAVRNNQADARAVSHTYQVEHAIADFRATMEQLETARRGYMLQPADTGFLDTYRQDATLAPQQLRRIRTLTADNPVQVKRVDALSKLLLIDLIVTDRSVGKVTLGGQVVAIRDFRADDSSVLMRQMRALTAQMSVEESRLLKVRDDNQRRGLLTLYGILAIAAILLVFVGAGSVMVIVRYTRDLTQSRDALSRLNEGLELAVRERTGDLKRANDEIQRFAYIVSHDLRSPLVNVMGFTAELDRALKVLSGHVAGAGPGLIDEETRHAVASDLPEAIGFIRSSTQKMDRLINAILALSRQGRRVLTPEPLDMTAILGGVADSLKTRADKAGAVITVDSPLPDITSDRIAIEQVFSNLMENAVKYSRPGQRNEILVSGWVEPGRVVFEVKDHGRGVDPKDHERIFELFRRAGVQDQAGEGIGLAHVRALIYRLGGLISCDSALDRGSTFRVSLPAHLLAEQGMA